MPEKKEPGIAVLCTGTGYWNIPYSGYKKDDNPDIETAEDIIGERAFPYIAIPRKATEEQKENLLFWAKSWSVPVVWKDMIVYQLRIKFEYVDNMKKELYEIGGYMVSVKR